jgi:tetratricopeptide (TPR) repeat protein
LHRLGCTVEAYETLKPACDAFPHESGPPYNLARICCALGQVEEAREWLAKALEIGGAELKLQALDDEELAAVW